MWRSVIRTVASRGRRATLAATPATQSRTATREWLSLSGTSPGALARSARLAVVSASNRNLASAAFSVHGLPAAPRTRSWPTRPPTPVSRRMRASSSVAPDRSIPPALTPCGTLAGSAAAAEATGTATKAQISVTSSRGARDMADEGSPSPTAVRKSGCGACLSGRRLVPGEELVDPAPRRPHRPPSGEHAEVPAQARLELHLRRAGQQPADVVDGRARRQRVRVAGHGEDRDAHVGDVDGVVAELELAVGEVVDAEERVVELAHRPPRVGVHVVDEVVDGLDLGQELAVVQ